MTQKWNEHKYLQQLLLSLVSFCERSMSTEAGMILWSQQNLEVGDTRILFYRSNVGTTFWAVKEAKVCHYSPL